MTGLPDMLVEKVARALFEADEDIVDRNTDALPEPLRSTTRETIGERERWEDNPNCHDGFRFRARAALTASGIVEMAEALEAAKAAMRCRHCGGSGQYLGRYPVACKSCDRGGTFPQYHRIRAALATFRGDQK